MMIIDFWHILNKLNIILDFFYKFIGSENLVWNFL
jgi:hypothetical protein